MFNLIRKTRAVLGLIAMGAGGDLLRGITAEQRRTNELLSELVLESRYPGYDVGRLTPMQRSQLIADGPEPWRPLGERPSSRDLGGKR